MISDQIIEEILLPHVPALRQIHDEALAELNTVMGSMTVSMNNRTKPMVLNNIIVEKAKAQFDPIPGIKAITKYGTLALQFDGGVLSRFKKLPKNNLFSCNALTKRNTELVQGVLFPDFYPYSLVEIAYVVNATWTDYVRILAVKRLDKAAFPLFEIEPLEEYAIKTAQAEEVNPEKSYQEKQDEENQLRIKKG